MESSVCSTLLYLLDCSTGVLDLDRVSFIMTFPHVYDDDEGDDDSC